MHGYLLFVLFLCVVVFDFWCTTTSWMLLVLGFFVFGVCFGLIFDCSGCILLLVAFDGFFGFLFSLSLCARTQHYHRIAL